MLIKPFASMCASCHEDQIRGKGRGEKAITVFGMPELDVTSFSARGKEDDNKVVIGEWPEEADGKLTPFMKLLLSADPAVKKDLDGLSKTELYDLADGNSAGRVVLAIKKLFNEIGEHGHEAFAQRLKILLGEDVDIAELGKLVSGLSADAIRAVYKEWLPNLQLEMKLYNSGKKLDYPSSGANKSSNLSKKGTFSIITKENENHLDDDEIPLDDDEIPLDDDEISLDDDEISLDDDEISLDDDEISLDDDEISLDDDEISLDDDQDEGSVEQDGNNEDQFDSYTKSSEEWGYTGGWFRNGFSILYRPTGHADEFLMSWLKIAAKLKSKERPTQPEEDIFDHLTDQQSPGSCMKCHSIDHRHKAGPVTINWSSFSPERHAKDFTKFSHADHESESGQRGCMICHSMKEDSKYLAGFQGFDASKFDSNFQSIKKETCVECHVPKKAGDSCLKCHNYHIRKSVISPPKITPVGHNSE